MIKNAKFTKKMAILLLIIAGVVGAIAVALIVINAATFVSQVSKTVAGGGGTAEELYKEYFVSNVLNYTLNIISVQGTLAVFSLIGGLFLIKAAKSDDIEEAQDAEISEDIEDTDEDQVAETTDTTVTDETQSN